ncbi:MAG: methyltransferase domain-containing protein [Solirubrobacterales bacterium]|nr:methyltransferase domain-containing protein [Solirubrobacterales bacterium]
MKDYYEELWERLPDELYPPFFQLRRRFLQEHVRAGYRALDLGCGNGAFTAALEQAGAEAVGVDVAEEALRRARKAHPRMRFMLAPFEGPLPLEDLAFDLVWASEVIEHVADTARWLSEVRRVLRPGGSLLVTTPNHSRLTILFRGLERFAEPLSDHLHLYTRKSLRETLERLHFRQIDVRAAGGPPLMRALLLAHAVR